MSSIFIQLGQLGLGYVMPLLISFLFFLSFFFFNDRLEQRYLGNYKTDLRQIFSMVDMLV